MTVEQFANTSLWDVEDVETMPAVKDMTIGPVGTKQVEEFCRRYHYTSTGGTMNWRWGLWHGVTLLGVVAYNSPTRSVCMAVFGEEFGPDHVWHMGRLSLAEDAPHNSESRLIGGSLRTIHREHPDVWAVLTYAATDVGHIGYVYQATNALYTGTAGDPFFYVDQDGKRRGTHLDGHGVTPERARGLGWTRHKGGPKHRYVYILGSKTERKRRLKLLRFPVLPYPKAVAA